MAAMTSSYQVDPNWYTNTGVIDHITSDLGRLTVREKYHGRDQIQVGNGAGLNISHIGHCSINTTANSLAHRDVLHVLTSHNLVSVHRLTKDNNVSAEFHPGYFVVKDQVLKKSLLHDRCKSGLYPIKSTANSFS